MSVLSPFQCWILRIPLDCFCHHVIIILPFFLISILVSIGAMPHVGPYNVCILAFTLLMEAE
jgi:hypothetical protein